MDNVINEEKLQFMVHCFRTESVVFRGTEEECKNYIKENDTPEFPLELYWASKGDKHYIDNELKEDELDLW